MGGAALGSAFRGECEYEISESSEFISRLCDYRKTILLYINPTVQTMQMPWNLYSLTDGALL